MPKRNILVAFCLAFKMKLKLAKKCPAIIYTIIALIQALFFLVEAYEVKPQQAKNKRNKNNTQKPLGKLTAAASAIRGMDKKSGIWKNTSCSKDRLLPRLASMSATWLVSCRTCDHWMGWDPTTALISESGMDTIIDTPHQILFQGVPVFAYPLPEVGAWPRGVKERDQRVPTLVFSLYNKRPKAHQGNCRCSTQHAS